MDCVSECHRLLIEGASGECIVAYLRERYGTLNSLRTRTGQVRNWYAGPMDSDGERALARMRELAKSDVELERINRCVATYGRRWWEPTGNSELDAYVSEHKYLLLPRNVRDVHITVDESREVNAKSRAALLLRHCHAPAIDGSILLQHCIKVIENPSRYGLYELALALLCASGRRTTEILNGKSSFECVNGCDRACSFSGQLKTKREKTYAIPLLVRYDTFAAAYARLNELQRRDANPTLDTPSQYRNRQTSQTYQSGLGQFMHKHRAYGLNGVPRVHALRGVYAKLVCHLFDCSPLSDAGTVQYCLGHYNLEESLAYGALRVEIPDRMRHTLGKLSDFVTPTASPT